MKFGLGATTFFGGNPGQPLRQRAADVGESAHLDERIGLRTGEQHAVRAWRRDADGHTIRFG